MSFLNKKKEQYIAFSYRKDEDLSIFFTTETIYNKVMEYAFNKDINMYFNVKDLVINKDCQQVLIVFCSAFGKPVKFKNIPQQQTSYVLGKIPSILTEYLTYGL